MKRWLAILLVVAMIFSTAACGKSDNGDTGNNGGNGPGNDNGSGS